MAPLVMRDPQMRIIHPSPSTLIMPIKRPADFPLLAPVKPRRSARLLLIIPPVCNSVNDPVAVKIKHEAQIKVEYDTPDAIPQVNSVLVKLETDVETVALKQEQLPPNPDHTFYPKIGSNIFNPVSPKDATENQPKNWHLVYNEVVKMRALISTPVDSFGCERLPDTITPSLSSIDPKTYRFQLLLSLMLSSQTKDETNFAAMKTLQQHYIEKGYPGICLDAVLASTEAEIDQCICKVGFHRRKAVYIKKSCDLLQNQFGGDVPKTIEEIVMLPGVGPKMGHLILQNGWNINSGIGVDVHLHRLAQMWGWVPKSDKPELTRNALEDWLPRKYWADINPLLVGFGQTVCAPQANNCDVCFLATGLCKGVNRKLVNSKLTEARVKKLYKQRGDLSGLVNMKLAQELS